MMMMMMIMINTIPLYSMDSELYFHFTQCLTTGTFRYVVDTVLLVCAATIEILENVYVCWLKMLKVATENVTKI